jgi:hypothetical protein
VLNNWKYSVHHELFVIQDVYFYFIVSKCGCWVPCCSVFFFAYRWCTFESLPKVSLVSLNLKHKASGFQPRIWVWYLGFMSYFYCLKILQWKYYISCYTVLLFSETVLLTVFSCVYKCCWWRVIKRCTPVHCSPLELHKLNMATLVISS